MQNNATNRQNGCKIIVKNLENPYNTRILIDAGQPTAHFNVLKYADVDPRRIIVDETAPLYYVGLESEYPPMRFVVSDNDMTNRYEQTMTPLMRSVFFVLEASPLLN